MPDAPRLTGGRATGGGGSASFDPPWWNTDHKTRFRLSIENGSSSNLPAGFQVGLGVDASSVDGAPATVEVAVAGEVEADRVRKQQLALQEVGGLVECGLVGLPLHSPYHFRRQVRPEAHLQGPQQFCP